MGTVFAHCLTAAQGAIVSFTAVLFSSSPLLSCSTAPLPAGASIHNRSTALAADCVEDNKRRFPLQTYENVTAATRPWGVMCEYQWKRFPDDALARSPV